MKKFSGLLAMILCLGLCTAPAESAIKRFCKVSYETRNGWSQEYKMEVTFATGDELNDATSSFRFSSFANYALLWFEKDEVAILKLKDFLINSGDKFTSKDFQSLYMFKSTADFEQVNSPSSRNWRVKAKEFISFIDPREQ